MIVENIKRYNKAKLGSYLKNSLINRLIFIVVALVTIYGLIILLQNSNQNGWFLLVPIVLVFMLAEWRSHDLSKLNPKITDNANNPGDILSSNILARLKKRDFDNNDIIRAVKKDRGYIFFYNRFFITDQILTSTISLTDKWWPLANQLWRQYPNDSGVDGAHISVAMLLSADNKNELLKSIRYSEDELMAGLDWYYYTSKVLSALSVKRSSGGIARDWASGYTPLLNSFAKNLSYSLQYGSSNHRDISSHQDVIDQMISIFTNGNKSNVALVGQVGVGKHMCVEGFAERLIFGAVDNKIKYSQVYQIDTAALISQTTTDQLDRVINQLMSEAYRAKNIILFFNDAGQLFIDNQGVDLSRLLLPIIEAGNLKSIFTFNDRDWQYIHSNKPALAAAFNYQAVNPTDQDETLHILENEALFIESQYRCFFNFSSIREIYRLADRYGPDVAMPEKAISVMNSAARTGTGGLITKEIVQQAVEASTGVKVGLASDQEKDVLLNLDNQMHQRVVGQEQAISSIVSALKRNRTGVSSSSKPIGTFLFLGPTGVGKTEVSKTLAATYFGNEDQIIRLDMNEFVSPDSINRLLNSGSQTSPSFLDQIKKQPFSVVLLDEFEKADQSIINAFLQLFDEGVIQDNDGRPVSFRDSIVIATSNAGADFIRKQLENPNSLENIASELTERLINEGIFKPELINRFDDVVIFKPLNQDQLRQIVAIMLSNINRETANQKITVSLSGAVTDKLVALSNNPAMGARPLRRLMQRGIETAIADKILNGTASPGDAIILDVGDINWELNEI